MYFVLMAGGSGTRLWPMSRRDRPKHLQPLVSDRSLLQETFDRIAPLAAPEQIYVCTLDRYCDEVREQLPEIPAENYLREPQPRNTGPAIGLAAAFFHRLDPDGVVASIAADHVVTKPENFQAALRAAGQVIAAHPDYLMTIGLQPEYAHPGLGYIQRGEPFATVDGQEVYRVLQFKEKPAEETARQYVESGQYYWNASYFIWTPRTMLALFQQHLPDVHQRLDRIQQALGTDRQPAVMQREYETMPKVAIDDGVVEKTDQVLVIPADLGWDDVGSWHSLHAILARHKAADVVVRGRHVGEGDEHCLIYGHDKLIATVGLKNVVVVETADAILVCNKDRAQDVKTLVETLQRKGMDEYL